MSEINVGANLMFARRTTIVCEPMSEAIVSNSFSNIGLIPVFVRRANTIAWGFNPRRENNFRRSSLAWLLWVLALLQQGRNYAPVFQNNKPLFFNGSGNFKPGHYFCLAVLRSANRIRNYLSDFFGMRLWWINRHVQIIMRLYQFNIISSIIIGDGSWSSFQPPWYFSAFNHVKVISKRS